MKQFMFLFKGGDNVWDTKSPEEQQEHMEQWQQWMDDIAKDQKLVGAERLYPDGKTIHPGGVKVTDRPLSEAKELVGGYLTVQAATLDEATEIAKGCPALLWESSVEVREIWPE